MVCLGDCCAKILCGICHVIKAAVAIAIIIIVAIHLDGVNISSSLSITSTCVMGSSHGTSLCIYAYVVAGVSLLASFVLALFLCFTCDLCGCGFVLEFALAVLGTLWWIAAAITFTAEGTEATRNDVPEAGWRVAVWILCWVNVGAFGFVTLVYLIRGLHKICRCCCGDDDKA